MQSELLKNTASVGGALFLTLTFLHPVFWAPAIACIGLAVLAAVTLTAAGRAPEPAGFHVALLWTALTLVLAVMNGAAHGFYNGPHIAFLLFGAVLGYVISRARVPRWAAWLPFALFAAAFFAMVVVAGDPGALLTRNSRNFVSVILLALYASAVLMEKRERVDRLHVAAALVVLAIAVAATGRGGIVTAILLVGGLLANIALRGRITFLRALGICFGIAVGGVLTFVMANWLLGQGLFGRLAERGLQDAPRLAMILAYFDGILPMELFLGRDYYDNSFLAQWDFNLHNSYLSAWAHLTVLYPLLILATLALAVWRLRGWPVVGVAVGVFALRALTDTQMLAGKYDYVFFAALFTLLRGVAPSVTLPAHPPMPVPTASGARET